MLSTGYSIHSPSRYKLAPFLLTLILMVCLPTMAHAELGLNLPVGVTPISKEIYSLHMIIFWVCVAIGVVVFSVMIYSMMVHRKSKGAVASNFHESTKIELLWTIVPLAILIIIAVPSTRVLIDIENTEKADMSVKITGYQWKWQYEYLDKDGNVDVSFFSNLAKGDREAAYDAEKRNQLEHYLLDVDNRLVVPINKRIRFLMTSKDVIHSWWVRDLGVKQDANPGYINDSWATITEPGVYRGQCAELCGKDHGFMPIVVEAKTQEDYDAWMKEQREIAAAAAAAGDREWTKDELMVKGQEVYSTSCGSCHGATGQGVPGVFPPMAGSKMITEGTVEEHIKIVMDGKAGTAMQAFKGQLDDASMAAVITYERNAFGNNTGDLVQPATIKAAR